MVDGAYVCNMSPSKNGGGGGVRGAKSFRPSHVLAGSEDDVTRWIYITSRDAVLRRRSVQFVLLP